MNQKVKLIWDFRGPDSMKIAKHHCIHLREFVSKEKMKCKEIDCSEISDYHTIAYMIVDNNDVISLRDALRPHRGERID